MHSWFCNTCLPWPQHRLLDLASSHGGHCMHWYKKKEISEVDPFNPPIYIRIPVLAQKVGDVGTKYRPKIMQSIKQILHTTEYQPRTSTENRRYTTL